MEGDIVVVNSCPPPATPTSTPTATFTNTPSTTPTATPTDTPAATPVLAVHVTWQGIPQPNSRNTTETITMTLRLGSGAASEYNGYTTDANGNVTLPVGTLASGTYTIRVKGR